MAALTVLVAIMALRGSRTVRLGLVLFSLATVPYLGLTNPIDRYPHRFCFLPTIGMIVALAAMGSRISRALAVPLAGIALAVLPIRTFTAGRAYVRASVISAGVLDALDAHPLQESRSYLVHGVPDSYEGAYVFRNGLPQAMRLRTKRQGLHVRNADRGGVLSTLHAPGELKVLEDATTSVIPLWLQATEKGFVVRTEPP